MSLLLDALKKAAEQKAEKSKEAASEGVRSDETQLDSSADDPSQVSAEKPPAREIRDETQIDHSELDTRLERTRESREDRDDTGLDIREDTQSEEPGLSEQMQTGEDETIIFADEDLSEFLGEEQFVHRQPSDETDLSQLADQTNASRIQQQNAQVSNGDETDLSQLADQTDASRIQQQSVQASTGDETDLSQLADPADASRIRQESEPEETGSTGRPDDTDLSEFSRDVDETDIARLARPVHESNNDDTVLRPGRADRGDDSELKLQHSSDSDDTSTSNIDDMSLLLRDQDDTSLSNRTSMTDPQTPQDQAEALQADAELGLVDITRMQPPPDEDVAEPVDSEESGAETQTSANTGVALNTLTTEATTTRADSTSTRTYAPDNYDRTLMRLPSDDASKLFAGMKSDSDVVMTPDYAKKVFQSKSSAQRVQHYKFYGGIALVILLGIGVYGLFEMQDESLNIENSLRPLKRDPMPGLIKPVQEETGLFAGVDAKTVELIENAESGSETEITEAPVVDEEIESEVVEEVAVVSDDEVMSGEIGQSSSVPDSEPETSEATVIDVAQKAESTSQQSSNLEISSSEKLAQKHLWLREAYDAYQAGDDDAALAKYNQVLEVDPANRNALLARAAINVQSNNSADAIKDYQTLLLANPKDTLAMTSLITVANYSPQETETQLKLMIRDQPQSPYLNFALANAYGAQQRWQEAQGYYFTALENNPDDPNYAYNLAVSLEHISKPKVAIAYYQRALDNIGNGLATFNRDIVGQRLEMLGKL